MARKASLREMSDKDLKECGNELCGKDISGRGNGKSKGDIRILGMYRAEQRGHCHSWRGVSEERITGNRVREKERAMLHSLQ